MLPILLPLSPEAAAAVQVEQPKEKAPPTPTVEGKAAPPIVPRPGRKSSQSKKAAAPAPAAAAPVAASARGKRARTPVRHYQAGPASGKLRGDDLPPGIAAQAAAPPGAVAHWELLSPGERPGSGALSPEELKRLMAQGAEERVMETAAAAAAAIKAAQGACPKGRAPTAVAHSNGSMLTPPGLFAAKLKQLERKGASKGAIERKEIERKEIERREIERKGAPSGPWDHHLAPSGHPGVHITKYSAQMAKYTAQAAQMAKEATRQTSSVHGLVKKSRSNGPTTSRTMASDDLNCAICGLAHRQNECPERGGKSVAEVLASNAAVAAQKLVQGAAPADRPTAPDNPQEPPRCGQGCVCQISSANDGDYDEGWGCEDCGRRGTGRRWHCQQHQEDFCFDCFGYFGHLEGAQELEFKCKSCPKVRTPRSTTRRPCSKAMPEGPTISAWQWLLPHV